MKDREICVKIMAAIEIVDDGVTAGTGIAEIVEGIRGIEEIVEGRIVVIEIGIEIEEVGEEDPHEVKIGQGRGIVAPVEELLEETPVQTL